MGPWRVVSSVERIALADGERLAGIVMEREVDVTLPAVGLSELDKSAAAVRGVMMEHDVGVTRRRRRDAASPDGEL